MDLALAQGLLHFGTRQNDLEICVAVEVVGEDVVTRVALGWHRGVLVRQPLELDFLGVLHIFAYVDASACLPTGFF